MKDQFAIVVSEFNHVVTEKLLAGARARLQALAVPHDAITVVKVPGAVEIPLAAQMLAKQNKFQAIICLGAVIRGETNHYDYVCQQVSHGCQQVMLAHHLPVIFGVLTTNNLSQALSRASIDANKGIEAVDAAMQMVALMKEWQT